VDRAVRKEKCERALGRMQAGFSTKMGLAGPMTDIQAKSPYESADVFVISSPRPQAKGAQDTCDAVSGCRSATEILICPTPSSTRHAGSEPVLVRTRYVTQS